MAGRKWVRQSDGAYELTEGGKFLAEVYRSGAQWRWTSTGYGFPTGVETTLTEAKTKAERHASEAIAIPKEHGGLTTSMTTADIVAKLLELIRNGPDPIDPQATQIEGEDTIGIEDPETEAMWFINVMEA